MRVRKCDVPTVLRVLASIHHRIYSTHTDDRQTVANMLWKVYVVVQVCCHQAVC